MTAYDKPFLPIPDQIALLQARGLDVGDVGDAEGLLQQYGYYRLSGYWHPLRKCEYDLAAGCVAYLDEFCEGATLAHAIELAEFDRRLRALFLEAIERIEIGVRVRVALHLGPRGALSHRDAGQFYPKFTKPNAATGKSDFDVLLERIDDHERRSKEQFAVHLRAKYGLPLPLWVSIEVWDFGMMSKLVGGMTIADQLAISTPLGSRRRGEFPTWLRSINHIRNICAHHSRLWNRSPADQPAPPREGDDALLEHLAKDKWAHVRLYGVAALAQFLLRQIDPTFAAAWAAALKKQFETFPAIPQVRLADSGFAKGWEQHALWN